MQKEQQGSIWSREKISRLELFKSPTVCVGLRERLKDNSLLRGEGAGCCQVC